MGCGASNTLESSEFRNLEQMQRTRFLKIKENEKLIDQQTEYHLGNACEECENEHDINKLLEEMEKRYPEINLPKAEQKDAVMYRLSKIIINKEIVDEIKDQGLFLKELLSQTTEKDSNKAAELFDNLLGRDNKAIFIGLENEQTIFLLKTIFQVLKFEEDYQKYNTLVILLPESVFEDEETQKGLGSLAKLHTSLKNLVIGISNDGSKPVKEMNNISYLFEGVSASKTIKSFGILRLHTQSFTIKVDSVNKICTALETSKLQQLGIANFSFSESSDLERVLSSIAKNPFTTLLGIQITDVKSEQQIEKIADILKKSKQLQCVLLGADMNDVDNIMKRYNDEFGKNNPSFKTFIVDYFKA